MTSNNSTEAPADLTKKHVEPKKSRSSTTREASRSSNGGFQHLGWGLVVTSLALAALVIFIGFNQRYWLLPPEQKLISSWKADLQLIKDSKQAELFKRVSKIRLRANDHSPAADWIEKVKAPIDLNRSGDLMADIFLIHQIEGHRYGVVIQYEFIETKTNGKIGEFARTLWLGVYY